MIKEKPAYKLRLRNLLPYFGARDYFRRTMAEDNNTDAYIEKCVNRGIFLMNYNIIFVSTILAGIAKGIEQIVEAVELF